MAIALTELVEGAHGKCDPLEVPWPRPVLRVVSDAEGAEDREPDGRLAGHADQEAFPFQLGTVRTGTNAAERRRRRSRMLARRRRVAGVVVVGAAIAGLALPLSALGGRPAQAGTSAAGAPLAGAGATVYVVEPGDTIWSIAERLDAGGNPRPLAEAIARETGSQTVVPGERIAVP